MSAHAANIDDDDPVVDEYEVYITPELENQQQIHLLQYMNRPPDQPLSEKFRSKPSQLRIKSESGFVEVDVPLDIHNNYNRLAGVKWGEALRKTKGYGQQAWGLSSGFERVPPPRQTNPGGAAGAANDAQPAAPAAAAADQDDIQDYVLNFDQANEKGHVLNTQTFGGQLLPVEEGKANYMVGVYRDKQLHLTPLNGMVQLRTQFNHLDAIAQLDAVARRREKEEKEGTKPAEPRAVLPTIKKAVDNTPAVKTKQFLHTAHEEKWTKVSYCDEEDENSFAAFHERLFTDDAGALKLHAASKHARFLDVVSSHGGKRKQVVKHPHQPVEISDSSDDEADAAQPATVKPSADGDIEMTG